MIKKKEIDTLPPLNKEQFLLIQSKQKNLYQSYIFQDKQKLGQGSFGTVFKVQHKRSGLWRALKSIPKKGGQQIERIKVEQQIFAETDHPHIARLFEYFEDLQSYYFVMEQCFGGDIFDKILEIGNFQEVEAKMLFTQIIRAIYYLQQNHIVHRDLKPENLLFQQKNKLNSLYLIDFGLANKNQKGQKVLEDRAGTIYYVAPEVLVSKYDISCDIWSLGVILYVLLCGYPPFFADTEKEIMKLIIKGELIFDSEEWIGVSKEVKYLLSQILTKNDKRISIEQIFQSPWLSSYLRKERDAIGEQKSLKIFNKQKLERWRDYSLMKKFALIFLSTQIDISQIEIIKHSFLFFNVSNTGRISFNEIRDVLNDKTIELLELLQIADYNKNNHIDYYGKIIRIIKYQFKSIQPFVQKSRSI